MLFSGVLTGCSEGLQTYSKYDISFQVSSRLKLEEYTVSTQNQKIQKGPASVEEGALISTDQNFLLYWFKGATLTTKETRSYILTTPASFASTSNSFKARITGNLTTEQVGDFELTFADLQLTSSGGKASGITAIWYCQTSQRIIHLIIIDKQAETEMKRFIQSFSCG